MRKMRYILFTLFLSFLFVLPLSIEAKEKITIYLFHSDSCPHCRNAVSFLEEYEKENDDVVVKMYELSDPSSQELKTKVQEVIGKTSYIPYIVIGSEYRVGFSNSTSLEIENIVDAYRKDGYIDVVQGIIDGEITKENLDEKIEEIEVGSIKEIPLLGKIDAKKVSLPLVAIIIGAVDGFNPCAMWILLFLITMLLNMKDKKKMWTLGIAFLLTSALVYLFFMVAWFNLMVSFTEVTIIQKLIGLFAIFFACYNLHNFWKERKKENGCVVVNNRRRKKIIENIRRFTQEKSFIIALAGIIVLAFSVNLVELACSAGLPLLFSQILAVNDLSTMESSWYMILYIFFFMLDDLIVFSVAMITLKVTGFTTKYSKYSHLLGGIIMLLIGILLIFKPEWIMFNF